MKRIRELRKEKGMSQISLSIKLNVSQKMISAYENGKSEPSVSMLMELAKIFDTSVDYIIGYTDIRQPIDTTAQQTISANECELLNIFRALPKKEKTLALGVLMGINASHNRNI